MEESNKMETPESNTIGESMQTPSDKLTMNTASSQKKNMPLIIGMVVVLLLVISGIAGFFLLQDTDKDLENPDELVKYLEESQEEVSSFEGVITGKSMFEGEKSGTFQLDTINGILYIQDGTSEAYYTNEYLYSLDVNDQWYVTPLAATGLSFEEISNIDLNSSGKFEAEDYSYEGKFDCIKADGECYKIYDSIEDNYTYFIKDNGRLDAIETAGEFVTYSFDEGDSIEIPSEVIDSAVDYSELLPLDPDADLEDENYEGGDFSDNLEEGDEEYYNSDEYLEDVEPLESL